MSVKPFTARFPYVLFYAYLGLRSNYLKVPYQDCSLSHSLEYVLPSPI